MKYPFRPEILDALPEELAELYRGLEDALLMEICSRLKLRDELNEVTVQDIKALRSHGIELKKIENAIRQTTGISEKKLNELIDDVVKRNQKYYTEVIDLARVTQPDVLVDATTIDAIKRQTQDVFRNITASMGFLVDAGRTMLPPAKAYQWALDAATLKVESGAISYGVIAALSRIEAGRGTPVDVLLLSDNKGSYNYTDLNRVAGAVLYVAEELAASGYSVTVTAKQGWTETDIPTQADIDQYLADIAEIRSALPVPSDTPKVPTMPLDYRKANDIESILILVDQLVQNIAKSWFYSGDLYSNEIK